MGLYFSLHSQIAQKLKRPLVRDQYDFLLGDLTLEVKTTLQRGRPLRIYDNKRADLYALVWPGTTLLDFYFVGMATHQQMQEHGAWVGNTFVMPVHHLHHPKHWLNKEESR